jgi:hypothetical protein
MFADKTTGVCTRCHFTCSECVDATKTGCLKCRGEAVFTTNQKKIGVTYESAEKMFDKVDKPPSGKELADMNFAMVRAMKTAPASRRLLAKEPLSASETAEFAAMDTAGSEESDKLATDMSDDKALNEIWNSGGMKPV